MADKVQLFDYSPQIKGALNEAAEAFLHTWGSEIASQAQRNCKMDGEEGVQLRGSYECRVDATAKTATIGSPLESAFWEEFGTGEHAVDTSKSRSGWWVYTPGNPGPEGYQSNVYADEAEAQAMAAYIRSRYGHAAVATNGRDPQHTLENAFKVTKPKMEADAARIIKETLGGDT